jgi:hypothetical protein
LVYIKREVEASTSLFIRRITTASGNGWQWADITICPWWCCRNMHHSLLQSRNWNRRNGTLLSYSWLSSLYSLGYVIFFIISKCL